MIDIKFTEQEIEQIASLANKRNTKNSGVKGKELGLDSASSHYLGLFGEAAVAKMFQVPVDSTLYPDGGDKHAPDLTIPNVGKIEVKTISEKYKNDVWLKVPVDDFNPDVDFYIATTLTEKEATSHIVGYATKKMILEATQRRTRQFYPLNYEIRAKDLLDIQSLLDLQKGLPIAKAQPPEKKKDNNVIFKDTGGINNSTNTNTNSNNSLKIGQYVKLKLKDSPELLIVDLDDKDAVCLFFEDKVHKNIKLPIESLVILNEL